MCARQGMYYILCTTAGTYCMSAKQIPSHNEGENVSMLLEIRTRSTSYYTFSSCGNSTRDDVTGAKTIHKTLDRTADPMALYTSLRLSTSDLIRVFKVTVR